MLRDLHNNLEFRQFISPQSTSADTPIVSSIIDLANVTQCELVITIGSVGDANATFAVLVEDGDNSSLNDNAAVADAYLLGTEAGAAFTFDHDDEVRKIGYIGPKRYVRMTITPTGNSGSPSAALLGGVAVLAGHRVGPQSSQS